MKKIGFYLLLLASFVAHSQTVRLIIVADEEDIKFGVTSIADEEQILRMFTNVQGHLDYKLKTTYLNHAEFTATKVRATLKGLRPQRRDIVVFYYTGRGYYPESSRSSFPYLQLKDAKSNPLSLDEVASIIDSKREALGLVIADCRDTILDIPETAASFNVAEDWVDKLVVEKLFLSNCGVIKLASSQKGQPTNTNRGGRMSKYTAQMTSNYFNLISFSTINMVDQVSLESLLSNVSLEHMGGQRINMEKLPCNFMRRRIVKQFPSYANVLSYNELSKKMRQLVRQEDVTSRKKSIRELMDNFTATATITLKQTDTSDDNNETRVKTMKATDYWQSLAKHDPSVKNRVVISSSVKRTDDFTKITAMEVQERLK